MAEPDWLSQLFTVASRTGADCVAGNLELALPARPVVPLCPITRLLLGEQSREEARIRSRKFAPGTGNMLIRRSVFDRIGPFDVSMTRGGEDDDLARRVFAQGFKVWSAPKAVAHHLIPPYRLSVAYFRSLSLRVGAAFAGIDNKQRGRGETTLLCIARIGQALLVNMPLLILACLTDDSAETLARKCLLWRTVGYARETLFRLGPRLFPQKRFFAAMEMRRERHSFAES